MGVALPYTIGDSLPRGRSTGNKKTEGTLGPLSYSMKPHALAFYVRCDIRGESYCVRDEPLEEPIENDLMQTASTELRPLCSVAR